MSQQNIDFGTFPDDPNADAIRTAFQKVQENFNQIFAATASQAVLSVNRLPGAGITVSAPTGNVIVTANIACVQFSTSTLSLGRAPTQSPSAQDSSITTSSQTMYINLPTTIANVDIIQLNSTLIANTVNVNLSLNGNVGNFSGNVSGANLSTGGILTVTGNANVGNIGAATGVFTSNVSVTSNVIAGNVYANSGTVGANTGAFANNITAGNVYANTGIIQAQYLKGDGSNIANVVALIAASIANGNSNVNIPSANGNVNISAVGNANILVVTGTGANITGTANITGNLAAANANLGNLAIANYYTGTLTTAAQPNITSVGTLTGLDVNGTVTSVNITANTGVFTGNGNGLSQLVGANVTGTVANATYANDAGNAAIATNAYAVLANTSTATTVYITGTSTAANSHSTLEKVTGIYANMSNNAMIATTFVGNLSGNVSGNIVGILANGNSNINIPSANGNVNISAIGNANIVVVTGTGANVAGTLDVTGNITSGNVYANTGTIGASLLTGTLTTAAQPNITSTGTLTGLGVNGTVTAVNITANTGVFTGNGNGLSQLVGANVTGTVANATYAVSAGTAGSVTTNAQGNITSVGTLTGLGVNGTVTAVNITANTGVFTGNGNGLSQLVGANVTGTVANATYAVSAGSATTAGTVTTNAQPNITSTGTLSALDVTGNITSGNVYANTGIIQAQYLKGDGSNLTNISVGAGSYIINGTSNVAVDVNANVNISVAGNANVVTVTGTGANIAGYANVTGNINAPNVIATLLTGTLTTAAQPNVTSLGTLTSLNVNGLSNLGPNGNVTITGGVNGAFLKTNGSGALTWDTGTLNPAQGTNTQVIFNDGGTTYAGNANLTFNKTTGALTVGGNANVGNIGATNGVFSNITGTLTTNAQPNITSVGTLGALIVSANINAGNITVASGNITVIAGTMTANIFSGNATGLSNIPGANVTGTVPSATAAVSATNAAALLQNTSTATTVYPTFTTSSANGNSSAVISTSISANLSNASITATTFVGALSGAATSATTAGTVTTNAQPNITSVGSLSSLTVTGNANVGNLGTAQVLATANVTAPQFISNIAQGTAPFVVSSATTVANLTANVALLAQALLQNTSTATTVYPTFTTSSANGNSSAVISTSISANLSNASMTATTFVGALSGAATSATTAGTVTTAAQPNITSVGTLGNLNVTSYIYVGSGVVSTTSTIQTSGDVSLLGSGAQSLVYSGYYSGNWKYATTGQYAGAVRFDSTAGKMQIWSSTNTGTAGANADVTPRLTIDSIGNVGIGTQSPAYTLAVNGNIAGGQIFATANITSPQLISNVATGTAPFVVTSTTQVANLSVATAGSATSATTAGTVTTNAQPNITSTGTLTGLTVSGSTSLSSSPGTGTVLIGGYTQLPSAASEVGIKFSGGGTQYGLAMQPITDGTTFMSFFNAANALVGSITQTASNVTWNGLVTGSNVTGTVSSATTAGTVTTAAQPNITSVGTLTSLTVNNIISTATNAGIEWGNTSAVNTPFIDFHSSGNSTRDYDVRLIASGGNVGGLDGTGTLTINAGTVAASNALTVATTANVTGNLTAGNVIATSFHVHGVATGISAAGATQATGTALAKDFNVVSTVISGANGVTLPTAVAGYRISIINTSANALNVYPLGNGIINSGAANAAYSQPAGARLDFICTTSTTAPGGQWYTLNATYG